MRTPSATALPRCRRRIGGGKVLFKPNAKGGGGGGGGQEEWEGRGGEEEGLFKDSNLGHGRRRGFEVRERKRIKILVLGAVSG